MVSSCVQMTPAQFDPCLVLVLHIHLNYYMHLYALERSESEFSHALYTFIRPDGKGGYSLNA